MDHYKDAMRYMNIQRVKVGNRWEATIAKLPSFGEEVLVMFDNNKISTARLNLNTDASVSWVELPDTGTSKHLIPLLTITHWMPFEGRPYKPSIRTEILGRYCAEDCDDSEEN